MKKLAKQTKIESLDEPSFIYSHEMNTARVMAYLFSFHGSVRALEYNMASKELSQGRKSHKSWLSSLKFTIITDLSFLIIQHHRFTTFTAISKRKLLFDINLREGKANCEFLYLGNNNMFLFHSNIVTGTARSQQFTPKNSIAQ